MTPLRKFVALGGVFLLLIVLTCAAVCAAPQPPCHKHHQTVKACDSNLLLDAPSFQLPVLTPGTFIAPFLAPAPAQRLLRLTPAAAGPPVPPAFSVRRI